MQPTLLVKSKNLIQATDFIRSRVSEARQSSRLLHQLKAASWSLAFASLFLFAQSYALSVQDIRINSALGEPLDAVVQINAAPGEMLRASCMRADGDAASGLPAVRGVRLSLSRQLSPGTLRLTTIRPVNEPMSEVVVQIECPGAPVVTRSFLIMLDPRGASETAATPQSQSGAAGPVNLNSSRSRTQPLDTPVVTSDDSRISVNTTRRIALSTNAPVERGSRYVVANGDSLSTIASRISGRDYGTVWSWAATIEAANPHAFINGNPNELIAGSELYIPQKLAPGTAGLTVPTPTPSSSRASAPSTEAAAVSRYADRFSTTTGKPSAVASSSETSVTETTPLTVTATSASRIGAIGAIQPVMSLATSFSSVSRDRLRQRRDGVIQSAPENLPDFVGSGAGKTPTPVDSTQVQNTGVPEQPAPGQTQSPGTPVAAKPELGTAPTSERRFSFFGLLAGLGLLVVSFFAGWIIAQRRADAAVKEEVSARLAEERYRERVRADRQDVTRKVLSGGAAAGIQVTESTPDFDPLGAGNPVAVARDERLDEDDLDEIVEAVAADGQQDNDDTNAAASITDNEGPLLEPETLDIDTTGVHQLDELDLELLERDYAAQTETNTNLEDIASAGKGNKTSIMKTSLDMEFPEEVKMRRESEQSYDSLEFDQVTDSLDFDIGKDNAETSDELSLDLEEAGANIDAQLKALQSQESEQAASLSGIDTQTQEGDGHGQDIDELIDALPEEDEFTATSTRDSEEFYHLEASSIMNIGELDFEKEPDDETNILRFHQRNTRTGTDDSSGENE